MASRKSYGKKMGGWRGRLRGKKNKRNKRDNPHIRQKHGERNNISLGEEYEVDYARREGQIKVNKSGEVSPVKGKTRISHGRLVREAQ